MSDLIWIQTIWHSDGISESIFQKVDLEKISEWQKSIQNYWRNNTTGGKPRNYHEIVLT